MIAGCDEELSGTPWTFRFVRFASSRYTASNPSRAANSSTNSSRGTAKNASRTRAERDQAPTVEVAVQPTVRDADEAIAIANDSPYGLCCSVYTASLSRAFRCAERLQCGVVNVNESAAYWDGRTPFGGYSGKSSGVGRLGGEAVITTMTQLKSIVLHIGHAS